MVSSRLLHWYVRRGYSQRVQEKRQQLLPEMRDLRQRGISAYITYDSKEGARLVQPQKQPHLPRGSPPPHRPDLGVASQPPDSNSQRSSLQVGPKQAGITEESTGGPSTPALTHGHSDPADLEETATSLLLLHGNQRKTDEHPTAPTTPGTPPHPSETQVKTL